jgi:TetR/AcrR family transcriptional repressor of nem operon
VNETAERLMDLAESHMRNAGYGGFSFRDLAAEIGIKSASVHHHFPTKATMAAAVARRYAGGLAPEVANEILSFFRRCIEDLSQRIGGLDAEARAFQVIATLEGGMMLARAYQDTTAFDHASGGLHRDSDLPAGMSRRKLRVGR